MKRRNFIAGLGLLPFAGIAQADGTDWQAKLVTGGFEGADFWAGLYVTLADGWHTYWRVPGESGIPPQIKVAGADVTGFEVLYPLPQRMDEGGGEAIGYTGSVMFPLRITTAKTAAEIEGTVSAFFGVCQEICKPAKFEAALADVSPDAADIKIWRTRVPAAGQFASAAGQKKDVLLLKLNQAADDIFVSGPDGLYFRKPEFSSGAASLKIDGLAKGQKLSGTKLTLTASILGKGLEQTVTIS